LRVPNESHPFPDEIHIEQLDVFTRIGVPEEERANPQKLTVSISLWPYQQASDVADHIGRAVRAEIVIAYSQQNDLNRGFY
jgi:FolB domain-containing protein